jgi:hypothetical protein
LRTIDGAFELRIEVLHRCVHSPHGFFMIPPIRNIILQHEVARNPTLAVAEWIHFELNPKLTAFCRNHRNRRGE